MTQVGVITVGGRMVGMITQDEGGYADTFAPDLEGYAPEGRASETPLGLGGAEDHPHAHAHGPHGSYGGSAPSGKSYAPGQGGAPFHQGSAETDQAIVDAARAHDLDPDTMRSIASIESSMNPSSNANRSTQYKGLYQVGREEWRRFGGESNIYSARDNAMATGRMFEANRNQFKSHFGRDPTDTELYLMHQQGLGFYTRGAMTNIGGNPYPGMSGPQTHESFEAGWGREVARRKARFESLNPKPAPVAIDKTDPMTEPM